MIEFNWLTSDLCKKLRGGEIIGYKKNAAKVAEAGFGGVVFGRGRYYLITAFTDVPSDATAM